MTSYLLSVHYDPENPTTVTAKISADIRDQYIWAVARSVTVCGNATMPKLELDISLGFKSSGISKLYTCSLRCGSLLRRHSEAILCFILLRLWFVTPSFSWLCACYQTATTRPSVGAIVLVEAQVGLSATLSSFQGTPSLASSKHCSNTSRMATINTFFWSSLCNPIYLYNPRLSTGPSSHLVEGCKNWFGPSTHQDQQHHLRPSRSSSLISKDLTQTMQWKKSPSVQADVCVYKRDLTAKYASTLQNQRILAHPCDVPIPISHSGRKSVPLEHLPPKRKFPWEGQRSPHPALL